MEKGEEEGNYTMYITRETSRLYAHVIFEVGVVFTVAINNLCSSFSDYFGCKFHGHKQEK